MKLGYSCRGLGLSLFRFRVRHRGGRQDSTQQDALSECLPNLRYLLDPSNTVACSHLPVDLAVAQHVLIARGHHTIRESTLTWFCWPCLTCTEQTLPRCMLMRLLYTCIIWAVERQVRCFRKVEKMLEHWSSGEPARHVRAGGGRQEEHPSPIEESVNCDV